MLYPQVRMRCGRRTRACGVLEDKDAKITELEAKLARWSG